MNPAMTVDVPSRYHPCFRVYEHDDTIGLSIRHYGEYQQQELDLLLSLPQSWHTVFDIGSNIGYHARAFASQCRAVYCFEASPQHHELLVHNMAGVDHGHIWHAAVTDHLGHAGIYHFDTTVRANYGMLQINDHGDIRVPAVTIDHLVSARHVAPPTLIKIDVEGHEPAALRGARNTIREYHPVVYFEAQDSANMPYLYRFFDAMQYQMYWCAVMNFNPNNFAGNAVNHFGLSAIFGVLALPSGESAPELPPVLNVDDTWEQLLKRIYKIGD